MCERFGVASEGNCIDIRTRNGFSKLRILAYHQEKMGKKT